MGDILRINLKQGCKAKIKPDQAQAAKLRRAQSRATVLASFRNISDFAGSPVTSPERPTCAVVSPSPALDRRQKLEKWRKEKAEKEKKDKANEKPIFKLRTVISHTSYPSLIDVPTPNPSKYIGMATRSRTATAPAIKALEKGPKKLPPKSKTILADVRADKKFNAPKSVKPLPLLTVPRSPFGMSRRNKQGMTTNTLANMPQQLLKRKFAELKGRTVFSAIASAPSPARNVSFNPVVEPVCAASSNITVARGNFQQRKRSLSKSFVESTALAAPSEGISTPSLKKEEPQEEGKSALFYRTQLDFEISRLNKLCNEWSVTKNNLPLNVSEDSQGVLDSVIGHTQLLIRSKFEQFRSLTHQCEAGTSVPPILVTDLEGFWDMLTIQIENLDKEFKNLDDLKKNGWKKKETAKVQIKKNTVSNKPNAVQAKAVKPSGLKALMLAARKKQLADKVLEDKFNCSVNLSSSCLSDARVQEIKETPERSTKRMSMLQGVLSSNIARKAERNSPIVMRVSLNAKAAGLLAVSNATSQTTEVSVAINTLDVSHKQQETVTATTMEDAHFVKPSVANPLLRAIRPIRKSMSEGKPRQARERKRLTMLQQLQRESKLFDMKQSATSAEFEKENENFASPSGKFFSPRRSLRLTPYKRRSLSADGRPSLMPLENWPSPLPLPSGELISFDTPPAVRRSTRARKS